LPKSFRGFLLENDQTIQRYRRDVRGITEQIDRPLCRAARSEPPKACSHATEAADHWTACPYARCTTLVTTPTLSISSAFSALALDAYSDFDLR